MPKSPPRPFWLWLLLVAATSLAVGDPAELASWLRPLLVPQDSAGRGRGRAMTEFGAHATVPCSKEMRVSEEWKP